MAQKRTLEDFVEKANTIHKNKYTYTNVVYHGDSVKVFITCSIHGDFAQTPSSHLQGHGCRYCMADDIKTKRKLLLTQESFVERAMNIHKNKYTYSNTVYKDSKTKVCVTCPTHGLFDITPNNHLRKKGCPKCVGRTLNHTDLVNTFNNIHNGKYTYEKMTYKTARDKICITCPTHGDFHQTPELHKRGCGCNTCNSSKGELAVEHWLKTHNIQYIKQYRFSDCKDIYTLPFDFYIPTKNTCVEYDGELHFTTWKSGAIGSKKLLDTKKKDAIKDEYCIVNNIRLIRIPYWSFNSIDSILSSLCISDHN